MSAEPMTNLNGRFWVKWFPDSCWAIRRFVNGKAQIRVAGEMCGIPCRDYHAIGPRIPTPADMQATELELAKLRNLADDLDKTFIDTREERDRLRTALRETDHEICQTLGRALGYPWFGDDQANFPGATDTDGVCVGDHVAESISKEAAKEVVRLREERDRLRAEVERLQHVPPTCKQSLPVQPEERVRCYRNCSGGFFWAATDGEPVIYFSLHDIINTSSYQESTIKNRYDMARFPLADALEVVRDRPKQLAKLKEMAGIETPKDSVRCYRSKYGSSVLVYGVQHNTHFSPHGDWGPAQSESAAIKNKIRCTISEARAMLADLPKSLAEFDRIAGRDENRKHLARLLAIPCKEMRI